MTEITALQNAANDLCLVIVEKHEQDKRKMKRYFATKSVQCVSPVLDYEQMNHFLLGWRKALETI